MGCVNPGFGSLHICHFWITPSPVINPGQRVSYRQRMPGKPRLFGERWKPKSVPSRLTWEKTAEVSKKIVEAAPWVAVKRKKESRGTCWGLMGEVNVPHEGGFEGGIFIPPVRCGPCTALSAKKEKKKERKGKSVLVLLLKGSLRMCIWAVSLSQNMHPEYSGTDYIPRGEATTTCLPR